MNTPGTTPSHSLRRWARALAVIAGAAADTAQAATVYRANIVAVASAINDFELAPTHLVSTWSQQGVRVTQVGGDGDIWLANGSGNGSRSWYPVGGDYGWTRITLDSGNDYGAIAFVGGWGSNAPPQTLDFQLADNGVIVFSGSLTTIANNSWFGFAGGDFDEVRIRASQGVVTGSLDCPSGGPGPNNGCSLAWLDDIRVGAAVVSEPSSVALALLGLGLMAFAPRPRTRATAHSRAAGVSI